MTPKEKAEQLVNRFIMNVLDYEGCSINSHKAKQCALVAADGILDEIKEVAEEELILMRVIYWEKVKQEIEKL